MATNRVLKRLKQVLRGVLSAIILLLHPTLSPGQTAFDFYSGPGSPTALTDISRLRNVELTSNWITSIGATHQIHEFTFPLALEAESHFSKHWERDDLYEWSAALSIRWLKTPWSLFGSSSAAQSTFAFGHGLSYVSGIPALEGEHLEETNRWLYYMVMEITFPLLSDNSLDALFRIHHRSGMFGLINHVIGGSDYLCLGIRMKL